MAAFSVRHKNYSRRIKQIFKHSDNSYIVCCVNISPHKTSNHSKRFHTSGAGGYIIWGNKIMPCGDYFGHEISHRPHVRLPYLLQKTNNKAGGTKSNIGCASGTRTNLRFTRTNLRKIDTRSTSYHLYDGTSYSEYSRETVVHVYRTYSANVWSA